MNWDALGALAELVGAVGVIGSLLYLARQVRTSNRAAAGPAKLESTRLLTDFMDLLIERPALNQLMLKGRKGLDSLSPDVSMCSYRICASRRSGSFRRGISVPPAYAR